VSAKVTADRPLAPDIEAVSRIIAEGIIAKTLQ